MSAITSEWLRTIAQEPAVRPVRDDRSYSRGEEFRIVLDRYMGGYIDHQQRRAGIIGVTSRHPSGGAGVRLAVRLLNRSIFAKTSRT